MAIPRNFTIKEQLKQNLGALTEKVLFTENPSIFTGRNKKNKLMEYKVLTPNTIEVTELIEEPITNKILTLKDVTYNYTETYKWNTPSPDSDNQLCVPVVYNHEYISGGIVSEDVIRSMITTDIGNETVIPLPRESGRIRTVSIPVSTISNRSSGGSGMLTINNSRYQGEAGTLSINNEGTMAVDSWSFSPNSEFTLSNTWGLLDNLVSDNTTFFGIDPARESSTTSTSISTTDIPSTPRLNTNIAYGNATINFNMSATETMRSTYHFRETIDRICNQLSEEIDQQIFDDFSRAIGIPAPIIEASDRLAAIKFISSIEHAKLKPRLLMLI